LLSGEVDVIEPVPTQDIARVDASPNAKYSRAGNPHHLPRHGPGRDELLYSNIKAESLQGLPRPRSLLQGDRRRADQDARDARMSTPSALMISPLLYKLSATSPGRNSIRRSQNSDRSRLSDGFEVTMDCPNDRYVNDAAICQAVVGMWRGSASR